MINFLEETIDKLRYHGKEESDVVWVGRVYSNYKSTWEDFCLKADFMYDNGYGLIEIPLGLIVVGKDFWLERHEYDGSEWWEFKEMPVEPKETKELELNNRY